MQAINKDTKSPIKAPNHLLHVFEPGNELALINRDTHSGEDWNGNLEGSMTEMTISNY